MALDARRCPPGDILAHGQAAGIAAELLQARLELLGEIRSPFSGINRARGIADLVAVLRYRPTGRFHKRPSRGPVTAGGPDQRNDPHLVPLKRIIGVVENPRRQS